VGEPPLFDVVYATGDIRDYRSVFRQDTAMQKHVNVVMRSHGILKGESKFYMSLAHTAADVAKTLDAFRAAMKSLPAKAA
jgi:glutamate-1-semialdehyde 2,1-aminomutase